MRHCIFKQPRWFKSLEEILQVKKVDCQKCPKKKKVYCQEVKILTIFDLLLTDFAEDVKN